MPRRARPAQARAATVKSSFHGKAELGSRATLRGGLLNLKRQSRASLPKGKGRRANVATEAFLGGAVNTVWSKLVGLELEAVAMEEHFAAVVSDIGEKLLASWYQRKSSPHGRFKTPADANYQYDRKSKIYKMYTR